MQKSANLSKPMRTTLDLDDQLLTQAKAYAVSERVSLTRLIEEGLALRLSKVVPPAEGKVLDLPVYRGKGGLQPAARKARSYRELLDLLDEEGVA